MWPQLGARDRPSAFALLCGGGSAWVVERKEHEWTITGPAPGQAVWIS
jgi:hypothetical protein